MGTALPGTGIAGRIAHTAMKAANVAVLGGDVVRLEDGVWRHVPDNWSCSPLAGENVEEFITRSCETARSYVINYSADGFEPYFALVPGEIAGLKPARYFY